MNFVTKNVRGKSVRPRARRKEEKSADTQIYNGGVTLVCATMKVYFCPYYDCNRFSGLRGFVFCALVTFLSVGRRIFPPLGVVVML